MKDLTNIQTVATIVAQGLGNLNTIAERIRSEEGYSRNDAHREIVAQVLAMQRGVSGQVDAVSKAAALRKRARRGPCKHEWVTDAVSIGNAPVGAVCRKCGAIPNPVWRSEWDAMSIGDQEALQMMGGSEAVRRAKEREAR